MLQRGRKSSASLSVVSMAEHMPRVQPPAGLTDAENALFKQLVAQCDPTHFTSSDAPLITAYTQAVLITRWAFKQIGEENSAFTAWQQAAKTMATLATKLRLCPHSRADAKTVVRRSRGAGISAEDFLNMTSSEND